MSLLPDERNPNSSRQTLAVSDSPQLELSSHELFVCPPETPIVDSAIRVQVPETQNTPAFTALTRTIPLALGQSQTRWWEVFFCDEERADHHDVFSITTRYWDWLTHEPYILSLEVKTRWFRPPNASFCLALKDNGYGEIQWQQGQRHSHEQFQWTQHYAEEYLWRWSGEQFTAVCSDIITDPASEFNYCKRWHRLHPEEKTALVLHCEVGDWDELVRLFTHVLQLLLYRFNGFMGSDQPLGTWDFTAPFRSDSQTAIDFARRWQKAIFAIIRPQYIVRSTAFTRRWFIYEARVEKEVSCLPPSSHDVMEAQLELREFLRSYKSASEIEALFQP